MENKNNEAKAVTIMCPYCNSPQRVLLGDVCKCPSCGATIATDYIIKNQKSEETEEKTEITDNASNPNDTKVIKNNEKGKITFNYLAHKWWFWVLIGFVFVTIVGAIGSATGKTTTVKINEWGEISDYQIRVVNVENKNTIYGLISDYTTQNNYLCIEIEIKNNSNSSNSFSYRDFTVRNGKIEYESKGTEAYYYAQGKGDYPSLYMNGNIDGGLSGHFYLVFETAKSSNEENYLLEYSYSYDKVVVDLSINK